MSGVTLRIDGRMESLERIETASEFQKQCLDSVAILEPGWMPGEAGIVE